MTTRHALVAASIALLATAPALAGGGICDATARLQRDAGYLDANEELRSRVAVCLNLTDRWELLECLLETVEEFHDARELVGEQYAARLELCALLGGDAYDPEIDPDDFVEGIDHPLLPFAVGAEWVYEIETDEGLEVIVVTVLEETREILGVPCTSVRDVVTLDGEPVEDTIDWYAQDREGNVWYFGEIALNFEDGYIADVDGSWIAGVDGAKPGIVAPAVSLPGTTYRQEWLINDAEDAATVLDDDATVVIGLGLFEHCVVTVDFTPVEPEALEHKSYAPGIGLILEEDPRSGDRLELVSWFIP